MITLTRNQVRRLRVAFRRAALGITHRGIVSELVLRAEGSQLRAQYRYCDLAIEHVEPGSYRPAMSIAIPLDALADFEGSADSPVVLESVGPDRTVVRWEDRGIPQSREYNLVTPVDRVEPMPALPATWASNPGDLLDALAVATEIGLPDSPRYSLECIQLQGNHGKILATDGRQGLVRSGYTFPWSDNLLIKGRPIFGCRAIPHDQPVEVGRTDTHVVIRAGAWTIYSEIQKEARFPDLQRVIPTDGEVSTRLRLDPGGRAVPRIGPGPTARRRRTEQPGDPGIERPDFRPGQRCRPDRAGDGADPQPVELYRLAALYRDESRLARSGSPVGLHGSRLCGSRFAVRLPR